MIDIFGWWAFDAGNEALVNTLSGERVRFVAKLSAEDAPAEGEWLRFQYEHDGLSYPLLVETGPAINDIFSGNRGASSNTLITISDTWTWQFDHIRSAALWCEEGSQDALYPSYGLWRRIDDCVSDALCYWPQRDIIGLLPKRILVAGGWVNGEWSDLWERMYCHWLHGASGNKVPEFKPAELSEAWLFPLDEPAPSPWQFHDCETGDLANLRRGNFEGEVVYPPRSLESSNNKNYYRFIPAEQNLTGFEGKTVYLQTKDKTSVIAYGGLDMSNRGRLEVPIFKFLYGDNYITASFCGQNTFSDRDINSTAPIHWYVENIINNRHIHQRFERTELYPDMPIGEHNSGHPDYKTWIRTSTAIRDAFLEFLGSRYRGADWHDWLAFRPSNVVASEYGYSAGIWGVGGRYCSSRYLADPQTLYNREISYSK